MATLKSLPPCPDNLKPMLHYLKAAGEHDTRDPVVAYWLRFHAVQLGIRIDSKSKPAKLFISGVMDNLEQMKKSLAGNEAITVEMVAQAHIENYAVKLFGWADQQDRSGRADKNVLKAFYNAGLLFDCLAIWGELSEEVARQRKYAKWKAAYLHNCFKTGETPVPGPYGGGEEWAGNETSQEDSQEVSGGTVVNQKGSSFGGTDVSPSVNVKPASPVAPPRTSNLPAPQPSPSTASLSSPSSERRGFATSPTGVQLTPEDVSKAQKYCKYAGSALQFDDLTTAVDLLEKTLRLLKTGRED